MFQLLEKILEDYLSRQKNPQQNKEENLGHIQTHILAIFKKTNKTKTYKNAGQLLSA